MRYRTNVGRLFICFDEIHCGKIMSYKISIVRPCVMRSKQITVKRWQGRRRGRSTGFRDGRFDRAAVPPCSQSIARVTANTVQLLGVRVACQWSSLSHKMTRRHSAGNPMTNTHIMKRTVYWEVGGAQSHRVPSYSSCPVSRKI